MPGTENPVKKIGSVSEVMIFGGDSTTPNYKARITSNSN